MTKFRSPHRPAHTVELGNLKFVGGRLEAHGYDAETVRIYARAHPEIGIVELVPPKPKPSQPSRRVRGGRVGAAVAAVIGDPPETVLPLAEPAAEPASSEEPEAAFEETPE